MSNSQSLDAVVSGCAYQYATTALGILEQGNKTTAAISPEMLCTLDNFIKVLLFNDRVFVTDVAGVKDSRLVPLQARFGGSDKSLKLFTKAGVLLSLPAFGGDQNAVFDKVASTLAPLDAMALLHIVLTGSLPKKQITVYQEMLKADLFFIESAIEQCGAQRFKPVFPGEHLYLGLRSKRLPHPHATHTMADIAGIRLRALIAAEMEKLNKVAGFGAPYLPPLPPIFVTQLLRNGGGRHDLTAQILALRDSHAFKSFRRQARKCMELAQSPDIAKRRQAADIVAKLEDFSFQVQSSTSTILKGIKLVIQIAKGDFVGIVLGQAESVIQYFSKYSLGGLEKFYGAELDSYKLDEFLVRNFGDKFNRNDLNCVSMFLGLPENIRQWATQDFDIRPSAGRLDLDTPPLSRPYRFMVVDPEIVRTATDEFEEIWKRAKPLKLDPKTGELIEG